MFEGSCITWLLFRNAIISCLWPSVIQNRFKILLRLKHEGTLYRGNDLRYVQDWCSKFCCVWSSLVFFFKAKETWCANVSLYIERGISILNYVSILDTINYLQNTRKYYWSKGKKNKENIGGPNQKHSNKSIRRRPCLLCMKACQKNLEVNPTTRN